MVRRETQLSELEIGEDLATQEQERKTLVELDVVKKSTWFRIWMTFFWLGSFGLFLFYLVGISKQHVTALRHPSSTINVDDEENLDLPKVIICNWTQNGNFTDPIPTEDCPECLLTLVSCVNLNDSSDCSSDWEHTPIQTAAGLFDCYTFNSDPNNPRLSSTTGYSGSISTIWRVEKFPVSDPPDPAIRAGAQVTFVPNDGKPTDPTIIYNEYNFASLSRDAFYSLTKVQTVREYLSADDPNYDIVRFDTMASTVTLLTPNNDEYGYVGISFAFQTLSLQLITFDVSYTLNNLFGDFAGMVGTLMGLDVIKMAAGLPIIYLGLKNRVLTPIGDHFNG